MMTMESGQYFFNVLTNGFHDSRIGVNQIIAAHARFTGNTCRDDHDIGIQLHPHSWKYR